MLESIKEYWYMWLVLAVLVVVLVFVIKKASAAASKRSQMMKNEREALERFKYLNGKYSNLTFELAEACEAKELAEGVTAVLHKQLEKSGNPDEEYKNAEQWKREVYALFYFDEDCENSLSYFFKNNAEPLPSVVMQGLKSIGIQKIYSVAAQMYAMYDEKNEDVSLDKEKVKELDEKFKKVYDSNEFFDLMKKYIIDNI